MANPSTAHEPSMEEILASIRQIISEDGEGAAGCEGTQAAPKPAPPSSRAGARTCALRDRSCPGFDAEPEPSADDRACRPMHEQTVRPQPFARTPEPPAAGLRRSPPQPRFALSRGVRSRRTKAPLLSPEKGAAVSGAFGALAQTILAQNSRTLEDVVAEMLQPMLKSWLDDNLPSLVERMVQGRDRAGLARPALASSIARGSDARRRGARFSCCSAVDTAGRRSV